MSTKAHGSISLNTGPIASHAVALPAGSVGHVIAAARRNGPDRARVAMDGPSQQGFYLWVGLIWSHLVAAGLVIAFLA